MDSSEGVPVIERIIHPVMDRVSIYTSLHVVVYHIMYVLQLKAEAIEGVINSVGGSPERQSVGGVGERRSTVAIEELERAFEFLETSNPGFSEMFVQCIVSHLQRG